MLVRPYSAAGHVPEVLLERLLVWLSFLLVCLPLSAQIRVTATFDGRPLADAEVCVYQVELADPRASLLAPELHCSPAGQVLDLPAKTYGWMVRQGDRLTTPHHGMVTGTGATDGAVIERKVSLTAGAHLDVSGIRLGEGEHLALIVGPTDKNRGATAPLAVSGGRALVPADTPITLVRVHGGAPVWVSQTMRLPDGATHVPRPADGSVALVWFRSDDPAPPPPSGSCKFTHSPEYMELLMKQELPDVELLDAKGKTHRAGTAADNVAQLIDSIYVFHGAAPGPAVLRVRGGRFVPRELKVDLKANAPLLVEDAVGLEIGSEVVVTVGDQQGLAPSAPACGGTGEPETTGREVSLWTCPQPFESVKLTPALTQRCRRAGTEKLGAGREAVSFAGVSPGPALVTLMRDGHVTALEALSLNRGETAEVSLMARELYVAGRVTRDGKPAAAMVRFLTGAAATDPASGEYVALLSGPPGRANVEVIACDDSFAYIHRPSAEVPAGPGFDLQIPANELVVEVVDDRTGKRLQEPQVTAAAVSAKEKPDDVLFVLPSSQRDGLYVIDSLEERSVMRACADHQGYQSRCSPPLTIGKRAERVTLRLTPAGSQGVVTATGYSVIHWVKPDGTIAERKRVDPSTGRFSYDLTPREEHAVLTGTAPLVVTRSYRVNAEGELQIDPPAAPQRQLQITIAPGSRQEKALITLWVDGMRVPVTVLSAHQIARRQPWFVSKDRPLVLREIVASEGLAVAIGPDIDFVTTSLEDPNLFAGQTPRPVHEQLTIP